MREIADHFRVCHCQPYDALAGSERALNARLQDLTPVFAEIDVLISVLRLMPKFIETLPIDGGKLFFVWNETTHGENFAEKWNTNRRLPQAFYDWNARAISDFENLAGITGLDRIGKELALSFGEAPVNKALSGLTGAISDARSSKLLSVSPILGLSTAPSLGVPVRHNTFFGA